MLAAMPPAPPNGRWGPSWIGREVADDMEHGTGNRGKGTTEGGKLVAGNVIVGKQNKGTVLNHARGIVMHGRFCLDMKV